MKHDPRYDAILHLEHPTPKTHPRMSMLARAAQFAAFNALAGFSDAVGEAARRTEEKIEPDEQTLDRLNAKMQMLQDAIHDEPEVRVTYFVPDDRKSGGAYRTVSGRVRRVDDLHRTLLFTDGRSIPMDDLLELDGALFADLDWF